MNSITSISRMKFSDLNLAIISRKQQSRYYMMMIIDFIDNFLVYNNGLNQISYRPTLYSLCGKHEA